MSEPDKALATMIANLEKNTGHDLDWWVGVATGSGKSKHGEVVAFLKSEHGLGHGYANMVAITARDRAAGGPAAADDLVDAQYRGKESLRPIYERLLAEATALGDDVEVAPKKASVSLRRSKQFALVEPATKTRIDLGLNLKGVPGTERLRETGGMCTHKVSVTDPSAVDSELLGWLRRAYDMA
mgnify:CR=1 FL=1